MLKLIDMSCSPTNNCINYCSLIIIRLLLAPHTCLFDCNRTLAQETERELEGYGDPLSLEGLFQATGGGIAENDALANGLPRTPEEQQQLRARLMGPLMLDLLSKYVLHLCEHCSHSAMNCCHNKFIFNTL